MRALVCLQLGATTVAAHAATASLGTAHDLSVGFGAGVADLAVALDGTGREVGHGPTTALRMASTSISHIVARPSPDLASGLALSVTCHSPVGICGCERGELGFRPFDRFGQVAGGDGVGDTQLHSSSSSSIVEVQVLGDHQVVDEAFGVAMRVVLAHPLAIVAASKPRRRKGGGAADQVVQDVLRLDGDWWRDSAMPGPMMVTVSMPSTVVRVTVVGGSSGRASFEVVVRAWTCGHGSACTPDPGVLEGFFQGGKLVR